MTRQNECVGRDGAVVVFREILCERDQVNGCRSVVCKSNDSQHWGVIEAMVSVRTRKVTGLWQSLQKDRRPFLARVVSARNALASKIQSQKSLICRHQETVLFCEMFQLLILLSCIPSLRKMIHFSSGFLLWLAHRSS